MTVPQTMRLPSVSGTVEVVKKDTVNGPSAEWEAIFPGGRRKSFYGDAADVRHAISQEVWRTQ